MPNRSRPPHQFRANGQVTPTSGGRVRVASAQGRAIAAYGGVIQAARAAGALSLGDYAQALQSAWLLAPHGGDRWSRPSLARVLRYCRLCED